MAQQLGFYPEVASLNRVQYKCRHPVLVIVHRIIQQTQTRTTRRRSLSRRDGNRCVRLITKK